MPIFMAINIPADWAVPDVCSQGRTYVNVCAVVRKIFNWDS